MIQSTESFYKNLTHFDDFLNVSDEKNFQKIPSDWILFLTDVRGSTDAIKAGRYREVNLLGASCISAVLGAVTGIEIPYIFGGDGATFAVPASRQDAVIEALKQVQRLAHEAYNIELRSGYVSVLDIEKSGGNIRVAKYSLSANNYLAQFSGGGTTIAEKWIKTHTHEARLIMPDVQTPLPDLRGLSCRWQPFRTLKGIILTLLIKPKLQDARHLREIIMGIQMALGHPLKEASPIKSENMSLKWPPKMLKFETITTQKKLKRFFATLMMSIHTLVMHIIFKYKLTIGKFSGRKYLNEMQINSDFKKYDDVLRMVIDCTIEQAKAIEEFLETLHRRNQINYGIHESLAAVMTCLVFSATQGQHVHFIDGSDGGYTLAAVDLKNQISNEKYA